MGTDPKPTRPNPGRSENYRGHQAGFGRSCLPIVLLLILSVAAFGHLLIRGIA